MKKLLRWCFAALVVATLTTPLEPVSHAYDMLPGEQLSMGSCLQSSNGYYSLCGYEIPTFGSGFYGLVWTGYACSIGWHYWWDSQIDANCGYGYGNHTNQIFSAGSGGFASMQYDGNFVLYNPNAIARWATNTHGYGSSAFLSLQDDGNLVVYYNTNVPVWSLF